MRVRKCNLQVVWPADLALDHIVACATAIQRPSPLQRDVGPKIMFNDGQMADEMRGDLGQKLHQERRGDSMGGPQGASTFNFFFFVIAIDEGKTSVNQPQCPNPGINALKPIVMS